MCVIIGACHGILLSRNYNSRIVKGCEKITSVPPFSVLLYTSRLENEDRINRLKLLVYT